MGLQLHETIYGKNFFEHQLPSLINAINRVADVKQIERNDKQSMEEPVKIYVCYQENSRELSIENPVIDEMTVSYSLNEVQSLISKWMDVGAKSEFTPAFDSAESDFFNKLIRGENAELLLYNKSDENSPLYYALSVRHFDCKHGLFPKVDEKTYDRLRKVMSDVEKAEKFGNALKDAIESDDEKNGRFGYYLAKAIVDDNIEDLLIAICGWTSKSLLNIAECGTAYTEEN